MQRSLCATPCAPREVGARGAVWAEVIISVDVSRRTLLCRTQVMKFKPVVPARRKVQDPAAARGGAGGAGPSFGAGDARFDELLRTVRPSWGTLPAFCPTLLRSTRGLATCVACMVACMVGRYLLWRCPAQPKHLSLPGTAGAGLKCLSISHTILCVTSSCTSLCGTRCMEASACAAGAAVGEAAGPAPPVARSPLCT